MHFGRQRGFLLDGEVRLRRWGVERRVIFWSSCMLMLPGILLMYYYYYYYYYYYDYDYDYDYGYDYDYDNDNDDNNNNNLNV